MFYDLTNVGNLSVTEYLTPVGRALTLQYSPRPVGCETLILVGSGLQVRGEAYTISGREITLTYDPEPGAQYVASYGH